MARSEGPQHDEWMGLTRAREFALWRTLWLARWAQLERDNADLRARVVHLEDRFDQCRYRNIGTANARGNMCLARTNEECRCKLFCLGCRGRGTRCRCIRVPGTTTCYRCGTVVDERDQLWVFAEHLSRIRPEYHPAE